MTASRSAGRSAWLRYTGSTARHATVCCEPAAWLGRRSRRHAAKLSADALPVSGSSMRRRVARFDLQGSASSSSSLSSGTSSLHRGRCLGACVRCPVRCLAVAASSATAPRPAGLRRSPPAPRAEAFLHLVLSCRRVWIFAARLRRWRAGAGAGAPFGLVLSPRESLVHCLVVACLPWAAHAVAGGRQSLFWWADGVRF